MANKIQITSNKHFIKIDWGIYGMAMDNPYYINISNISEFKIKDNVVWIDTIGRSNRTLLLAFEDTSPLDPKNPNLYVFTVQTVNGVAPQSNLELLDLIYAIGNG